MTSYLIDSNVLLRDTNATSAQHLAARSALQVLAKGQTQLIVASQNLIEFWAVATRPLSANGLELTIEQAETSLNSFTVAFILLPDTPQIHVHWKRLVTTYKVQGKPSHDARLVAFMLTHGITHLLTFNGSDFGRYTSEGITVIDPAQINAPTP